MERFHFRKSVRPQVHGLKYFHQFLVLTSLEWFKARKFRKISFLYQQPGLMNHSDDSLTQLWNTKNILRWKKKTRSMFLTILKLMMKKVEMRAHLINLRGEYLSKSIINSRRWKDRSKLNFKCWLIIFLSWLEISRGNQGWILLQVSIPKSKD